MIYGVAGVAFASFQRDVRDGGTGRVSTNDEGIAASFFGAGTEYRLGKRLSVFGEGLYYTFGDETDLATILAQSDPGERFGLDGIVLLRLGLTDHV